jgi:hypothetical protein
MALANTVVRLLLPENAGAPLMSQETISFYLEFSS